MSRSPSWSPEGHRRRGDAWHLFQDRDSRVGAPKGRGDAFAVRKPNGETWYMRITTVSCCGGLSSRSASRASRNLF